MHTVYLLTFSQHYWTNPHSPRTQIQEVSVCGALLVTAPVFLLGLHWHSLSSHTVLVLSDGQSCQVSLPKSRRTSLVTISRTADDVQTPFHKYPTLQLSSW